MDLIYYWDKIRFITVYLYNPSKLLRVWDKRLGLNVCINSHKKIQQDKQFIKIWFHIYMKLNMFRATQRPSSASTN